MKHPPKPYPLLILLLLLMPGTGLSWAKDTVRIAFLGDIMMHQAQLDAARIPGADPALSSSYDFSSYFRNIHPLLDKADLVVANLECTLESVPYSGYPCFSAPASLLLQAQKNGIDLFLCANNHIVDKGRKGLENTVHTFEQHQAAFTGCYRDSSDLLARDPYIIERKGQRLAFINFTYGTNGIPLPSPWIINRLDSSSITGSLQRAKAQQADWIIALPHWGEEYRLTPSGAQEQWACWLHKQGVRIIIGSHPHVVQPLQESHDGYGRQQLCWYSLGNAISNMSQENTRTGFLVEIALTRDLLGRLVIADYRTTWLWCSRAGGYEKGYTILPIEDFLGKRATFLNPADYDRMVQEYKRIKPIIEEQ